MPQPLITRTCSSMYRSRSSSSPAALFLSHCRRGLSSSARSPHHKQQFPDFLLPSLCHPPRPKPSSRSQLPLSQSGYSRPFSATPAHKETSVVLNPRTDEEGLPMTIEISPGAAKRLQQITSLSSTQPSQPLSHSHMGSLAPEPPPSFSTHSRSDHLRVSVTSGGCHGFQYLMSLEPADKISEEEDTVFVAAAQDSGAEATPAKNEEEGKAVVVLDEPSLELLRGSTIDYAVELIGSQFKIVGNPRAKSSCGCGTSFDVED